MSSRWLTVTMIPCERCAAQNAEDMMDWNVASFSITRTQRTCATSIERISSGCEIRMASGWVASSMIDPSRLQIDKAPAIRPLAAAV